MNVNHKRLHEALDTLLAYFLANNPGKRPSTTTILELMDWSFSKLHDPGPPAVINFSYSTCSTCAARCVDTGEVPLVCGACALLGPPTQRTGSRCSVCKSPILYAHARGCSNARSGDAVLGDVRFECLPQCTFVADAAFVGSADGFECLLSRGHDGPHVVDRPEGGARLIVSHIVCESVDCESEASARVLWPGQTSVLCARCTLRARNVAQAMGFELETHELRT